MTPKQNLTGHRRAFTLIEMMIVIGIIALLAALTLGISNSVLRNSEISRTKDALRLLDMALQEWELEMGRAMTFRDFSSPAGEGGGFGQGTFIDYSYDINVVILSYTRSGPRGRLNNGGVGEGAANGGGGRTHDPHWRTIQPEASSQQKLRMEGHIRHFCHMGERGLDPLLPRSSRCASGETVFVFACNFYVRFIFSAG